MYTKPILLLKKVYIQKPLVSAATCVAAVVVVAAAAMLYFSCIWNINYWYIKCIMTVGLTDEWYDTHTYLYVSYALTYWHNPKVFSQH